MKQKIANYTVIIEQEKRTGTNNTCYTAFVPILGIATEGDSLEQVQEDIKSLVQFHLESLAEEGGDIPLESKQSLITRFEAILPKNVKISFS